MHKEVTSDGEIITHVHPYDFTKKKNQHQHKTDAEIRYLDVVFQGSFVEPSFVTLSIPIRLEYEIQRLFNYSDSYFSQNAVYRLTRGPPYLV